MLRALVCLSMLLAIPVHAADTARARLEAFSGRIHTVSAHFEQSVLGAKGNRGEPSSGTLALKTPRQFRWHTTEPFEQLIIADATRNGGFPPLMLDPVDFVGLYRQNMARQAEQIKPS